MLQELLKKVHTPPKEFRSSPFWAWNCELDPARLCEEIRAMKKAGFGGFFMHSRYGLTTPYLGKAWFDAVRACINEAEKLDMEAWLYDEDRWPSGVAGGLIGLAPEEGMHGLFFKESDAVNYDDPDKTYFFALTKAEKKLVSYRRMVPGDVLKTGEIFLRVEVTRQPASDGNNGVPYLDTLNPAAVRKFIDSTHERYAKEIPEELGKRVPGIFTDEPSYRWFAADEVWSPCLPECFLKRNGYAIEEKLPELYYETEGCPDSKVRLDFYNTATAMFTRAFGQQIGEWCAQHGMMLTGHVLGEESIWSQYLSVGAAMRFYQYMQLPGMDVLTEYWNVFDAPKQVASVARQQGKTRRLSELYGCTDWDFSFEGQKALGDWHAALGINLRCQHLFWASMEGQAKRDCPGSLSPHAPWFDAYRTVEDYFARLFSALSEGEEVRDVLVIHPVESFWFHKPRRAYREDVPICKEGYFPASDPAKAAEERRLTGVRTELLKNHLDFDYGDEALMAAWGKVEQDQLAVALAHYRAVVIPEVRTLRATTLQLLADFAAAGGMVVYLGEAPRYVDGTKSSYAETCYQNFTPVTLETLAESLAPFRQLSIASDGREIEPVLYNLHQGDGFETLFCCNLSMDYPEDEHQCPSVAERRLAFPEAEIAWKVPETRRIYELDLNSGAIRPVPSRRRGDFTVFAAPFARLGSHFFLATEENIATAPAESPDFSPADAMSLTGPWRYTLEEDNLLVFDHFDYAVNGGERQRNCYYLAIDDELHRQLGIRLRRANGFQPWFQKQHPEAERKLTVTLYANFTCATRPPALSLGIEHPEQWQLKLNGNEVKKRDSGWWCDPVIRKIGLPAELVKPGENVLELTTEYSSRDGALEAVYLFGAFGTAPGQVIAPLPETVTAGDLVTQGFTHYAGNVVLEQDFEYASGRLRLVLGKTAATAVEVRVNGGAPVMLAWPPYELELTSYVHPGKNTLSLRLFGHRRNALGAFYTGKKDHGSGAGCYLQEKTVERRLVPFGLLSAPELLFNPNGGAPGKTGNRVPGSGTR